MAMMYGNIDKSKEKRDDLSLIVKNLTKVTTEWDTGVYSDDDLEKLVQDALESALKLKGGI